MKHSLFLFLAFLSCHVFAQATDSISTPLGDFVVVTTEEILESNGYEEESTTTSDGGSAEFLMISSGARFAGPQLESTGVLSVRMNPNPANEIVQLDISGVSGSVEIAVTDLLGREVYNNTLAIAGSRVVYLPTQTWTNGTFLVVIRSEGQQHTERLIVE